VAFLAINQVTCFGFGLATEGTVRFSLFPGGQEVVKPAVQFKLVVSDVTSLFRAG
jgi:hypothetical protein